MSGGRRVILLGSARLLYACARTVRDFYRGEAEIQVIDTQYTPMSRRYEAEFGDTGAIRGREAVFSYLRDIGRPAFLLSVNNTYIFPRELCESPRLTIVNLHHGLLPRHPGRNAEAWTIYDMDGRGGITWHYVSAGIDTGDIICRRSVELTEDMTSLKLLRVCEGLALQALREELLPLEALDRARARRQEAPPSPPRRAAEIPNGGRLDPAWDLRRSWAFLRAMDYGPLRVLGRPEMLVDGEPWVVTAYRIGEETSRREGAELRPLPGGGYEYVLREGARSLRLRLEPPSRRKEL